MSLPVSTCLYLSLPCLYLLCCVIMFAFNIFLLLLYKLFTFVYIGITKLEFWVVRIFLYP